MLQAAAKALLRLLSDLLLNLSSSANDCDSILVAIVSMALHSFGMLKLAAGYRSAVHDFNRALKIVCDKITEWIRKEFRSPLEVQSEYFWKGTKLQEMRVGREEYLNVIEHLTSSLTKETNIVYTRILWSKPIFLYRYGIRCFNWIVCRLHDQYGIFLSKKPS